jgi:hypothetical protein
MPLTPGPVQGSIQFTIRPDPGMQPGDVISVHVIKRLDPGKWAVGIAGRVYPATSDVGLQAGAVLRARVGMNLGKLVLTLVDSAPDAVRAAIQGQGFPAGGAEELIARALSQSGLPIQSSTIQKVKALLTRAGMEPAEGARAAATLIDKGIDPASDGAAALLPVLGFGRKGGQDPRRYKGKHMPETPHDVAGFVSALREKPDGAGNALQAYNHLKGASQSWVVIPFVFGDESQRIAGTIKLQFDPFGKRPLAFALVTEDMSFHLPLAGKEKRLSIFCDDQRLKHSAEGALDGIRSKFNNMGFEVDDTINRGNAFDGFSPIREGMALPSIDTVG